MLRVEASNLPKPRGALRARRLLPNPPVPRRGDVSSRHEILPPRDQASPLTTELAELALAAPPKRNVARERWSVRLELGDEEIAKLYGQGLTRGAVVWKKGMVEWRPLLITPELSGLLHRTRITVTDSIEAAPLQSPPLSSPSVDEVTLPRLPRPASLPAELRAEIVEKPSIPTVAPIAMDVEAPSKPRRSVELVAVAIAAFTLAWLGHAGFYPAATSSPTAMMPQTTPAGAAPVCEPAKASANAAVLANSSLPTIAVTDLPLIGAPGAIKTSARAGASRSNARSSAASSGDGPSRADLMGALSQVARAASSCGERGDGAVRVVLSFANSGVARSVQVSGPGLPPQTRSCMIGAASRARVPAFSGDPVTVAKTL